MTLAAGPTPVLNDRWIKWIYLYPTESDDTSSPESISDTEKWLHWNSDVDNPNESEDDSAADDAFDVVQQNSFDGPESPEQWDVCAAPNVPRSIWPSRG